MNYVSYSFLLGSFASVLIYYLVPLNIRWIVLLAFSILFYLESGIAALLVVLLSTVIAWGSAILIEKTEKKDRRKRRLILSSALVALVGFLVLVKITPYMNKGIPSYLIPLGISYYTFSLISYMADVYWGKDQAERNFLKLALFVLFFPKIVQGPISRHRTLGPALLCGHRLSSRNLAFGVQLMIWGYFKKLVIADRAGIFVDSVFATSGDSRPGGAILFIAVILSAFRLYCDFSGCMDIARGISQMFGIDLDLNFNHPFFSKTAAEFWRRWHITLGTWFKDYVYMPIVLSPKLIKLSGSVRKKWGKRAGKTIMNVIPLSIVWILTGLWHGTGINYIIWGIYWGLIIILSDAFSPEIKKLTALLHINTEAPTWKLFQMLRTFGIFCGGRLISSQSSLGAVKEILKGIIRNPKLMDVFNGTLYTFGLKKYDFAILAVSIVLLWLISMLQEKGSVRETIAGWNCIPRWILYGIAPAVVVLLGIYGSGYSSSFVYQFF